MAIEYTSTVPAGTLPYSAKLAAMMILAAVEDTFTIGAHPAIVDLSQVSDQLQGVQGMTLAGTFSLQIADETALWSSTDEATSVATPTDIDPTYVNISVTNYDVAYAVSDELRRRDATGEYNWPSIAQRIVRGWQYTEASTILALADSMTNIAGAATDPTSWDTIREAKNEIEQNGKNPVGSFLCVLHTNQWALVAADIESRGGAIQMRRELDEAQAAGMGAYKGSYDGIDFFVSDRVPVSTGVYSGMMVAPGGVGYLQIDQAEPTASIVVVLEVRRPDGGLALLIEEDRDTSAKTVRWVGAKSYGATIVKQALCCRVRGTGRT
jgi:hypothetical protein